MRKQKRSFELCTPQEQEPPVELSLGQGFLLSPASYNLEAFLRVRDDERQFVANGIRNAAGG